MKRMSCFVNSVDVTQATTPKARRHNWDRSPPNVVFVVKYQKAASSPGLYVSIDHVGAAKPVPE